MIAPKPRAAHTGSAYSPCSSALERSRSEPAGRGLQSTGANLLASHATPRRVRAPSRSLAARPTSAMILRAADAEGSKRLRFVVLVVLPALLAVQLVGAASIWGARMSGDEGTLAGTVIGGLVFLVTAISWLSGRAMWRPCCCCCPSDSGGLGLNQAFAGSTLAIVVMGVAYTGLAASSASYQADGTAYGLVQQRLGKTLRDGRLFNPSQCAPWVPIADSYSPWPPETHLPSTSCDLMPYFAGRIGHCGLMADVPEQLRGRNVAIVDWALDATICVRQHEWDDFDDDDNGMSATAPLRQGEAKAELAMEDAAADGLLFTARNPPPPPPSSPDHDPAGEDGKAPLRGRNIRHHVECLECRRVTLARNSSSVQAMIARLNASLTNGTVMSGEFDPAGNVVLVSMVPEGLLQHLELDSGGSWAFSTLVKVREKISSSTDAPPTLPGAWQFGVAELHESDLEAKAAEAFDLGSQLEVGAMGVGLAMQLVFLLGMMGCALRGCKDACPAKLTPGLQRRLRARRAQR